jgi:cytochrome P450
MLALHQKYGPYMTSTHPSSPHTASNRNPTTGPVVRIAPNELSFNTAQSWKDIYDFGPNKRAFIKSNFYEGGTFADQCGSIVSERNPESHGQMRRLLSHAFSQRSLIEQESLIADVIDIFMRHLEKKADDREAIDFTEWYNMMT